MASLGDPRVASFVAERMTAAILNEIVSVPDVGVLMRSALSNASPAFAEKIPSRVTGIVASVGDSGVDRIALQLGRAARRSSGSPWSSFLAVRSPPSGGPRPPARG